MAEFTGQMKKKTIVSRLILRNDIMTILESAASVALR